MVSDFDAVEGRIEDLDVSEDHVTLFAWVRLADGRCALWRFDLRQPVGEAQTVSIVDGA